MVPTCAVFAQGNTVPDGPGPMVSLQLENDVAVGEDGGYTSGIRASLFPRQHSTPDFIADMIRPVSLVADRDQDLPYSISIEQLMFTPEDVSNPEFPPEDRPFAGWLNLTGSAFAISDSQLERWQLGVGVVGPASLAEQSQKATHTLTAQTQPVGWESQLPNEPTLQLGWDRQWRIPIPYRPGGLSLEVSPMLGGAVGNAVTGVEAGSFIRLGDNIPLDFGPPRLRSLAGGSAFFRPQQGFGWYLYAGAAGRYKAHDIFLDGSLFQDTDSVDKEPFIGQGFFGAAFHQGPARLVLTGVLETDAFEQQDDATLFGAASLSWQF